MIVCGLVLCFEITLKGKKNKHVTYGLDARKSCLQGFGNNKGADQPAHPRSLISAFVIRLLESIICKLATGEISILKLVSVAEETGFKLTLSETPKKGFLATRPIFKLIILPNIKALILDTLNHIYAMKALRICNYVFLLHVLLKTVTKCLVTWADTACDSKPITARSYEPISVLT